MNAIRLAFFVTALLASLAVSAGQPDSIAVAPDPSPRADETWEPLPLGVGLRVWIDPETGRFREPTRQEALAAAESARASKNKSIEGLEVEYRADGSKHVDLQDRFMHSLRVSVSPDGTTSFNCTDRDHDHDTPATAQPAPADR